MNKARAPRHLLTWLAIVAILMASLAPTISRALAACNGRVSTQLTSAQLCTTNHDAQADHDRSASAHTAHSDSAQAHSAHDHAAHDPSAHDITLDRSAPQALQVHHPDPASPSPHSHTGIDLDHCGYCYFDHHTPTLPGLPASLPLVVNANSLVPTLFLQAPRLPTIWRSAQPRGPPGILPI